MEILLNKSVNKYIKMYRFNLIYFTLEVICTRKQEKTKQTEPKGVNHDKSADQQHSPGDGRKVRI